MRILVASFKRSHAHTATLSAPDHAAGHHQPMPPLDTPEHSLASLGQAVVGSLILSPWLWYAEAFVYALQESASPILCKFWQLYDEINGDLLQKGLCHTQVCCTKRPCPCSTPLLTGTSTGVTQTQSCLSLCGVSGFWCIQGFLEPSEHLWQVWGFILNVILPLLPSCLGFSFAL